MGLSFLLLDQRPRPHKLSGSRDTSLRSRSRSMILTSYGKGKLETGAIPEIEDRGIEFGTV
jgi:hypothetical protein